MWRDGRAEHPLCGRCPSGPFPRIPSLHQSQKRQGTAAFLSPQQLSKRTQRPPSSAAKEQYSEGLRLEKMLVRAPGPPTPGRPKQN